MKITLKNCKGHNFNKYNLFDFAKLVILELAKRTECTKKEALLDLERIRKLSDGDSIDSKILQSFDWQEERELNSALHSFLSHILFRAKRNTHRKSLLIYTKKLVREML